MSGEAIIFLILSFLAVAGGVLMISLKKVMHMMLALILSFISVAGIFVMLSAEFIAAVQVMLYSGAIAILMIFGIMLTKHNDQTKKKAPILRRLLVLIAIAGFAAAMAIGIYKLDIPTKAIGLHEMNTEKIGLALYSDYIIPFELASIVLLVALVGAILLAKKDEQKEGEDQ